MFFIKVQDKIESSLTKKEAVQRLCEITNTSNKYNDLFVGQISDSKFEIRKRPSENIRNAFAPVFVGELEDKKDGCYINITARLNHFVAVGLLVWSLGAIVVPLIIGVVKPIFFLPALVFAFTLTLLILFAFYMPAKKGLKLLRSILIK